MARNLPTHASMEDRLPLRADSLSCRCGGSSSGLFKVVVASERNPCPECDDLIIMCCASCGQSFCAGCFREDVRKVRGERGVDLLMDAETLS